MISSRFPVSFVHQNTILCIMVDYAIFYKLKTNIENHEVNENKKNVERQHIFRRILSIK